MTSPSRLAVVAAALACSAAVAPDMLPLRHGVYAPANVACRGASRAELVNYWGGKSSIGYAQAECTITRLTRKGNLYTVTDVCRDIASRDAIEGGPTVIAVGGPTTFRMNDKNYRYCGPKATSG